MTWQIYAISALTFFVILDLTARRGAVKSKYPVAFSVIFNSIASIFAFSLLLIEPFRINYINIKSIIFTILVLTFYTLYERMHVKARKYTEASMMTIIFRLSMIMALIGSVIILHEKLTLSKIIAFSLILVANIIVLNKVNFKINSRIWYAVVTALVLGMAWVFDKPASLAYSVVLYQFIVWVVPPIINLITPPIKPRILINEFKVGYRYMIIMAFCNVFGYYLYLKAIRLGEVSNVIPITSSVSIMVIILGIFLFNEKSHYQRKIIAGIIATLGIILVSI